MKYRLPGLTVLLSVAMMLFVSILLVSSMTIDLNNRKDELTKKSISDIKKQIAKLTRLAERVLIIDPQLLFEDISQEGSDPRVAFSAVILNSGKILFSTDFSQNNKLFDKSMPYYDKELYDKAISVRTMQLKIDADSMLAYMSFSEPADKDEMRGLNKGIVVINYNLKTDKDNLFKRIIEERLFEIIVSLIVTVIFIVLIRKYIISPVLLLQESAHAISKGDYKKNLTLTGPVEIRNLMTSFNEMSDSLQHFINDIKENNRHTETVIENVVDGIITIDTKGIVLSYNRAAEIIFGYSRDEIIGQNVNKLMTEVDFRNHDQHLNKYINSPHIKVIGINREIKGLRKNGEIFPVEIGVSEIQRNNQRLFIGIIRDVSEKYKAEKIKREFVSTVSHELRTPLTAMQGAVTLISSGVLGELPEQASGLLVSAKRNGDRLLALINDLLDMDKIIEGKIELNIEPHDVQKRIDEAIEANVDYAKRFSVKINKSGDFTPYNINVDSMRFQQILSNFISNACKFSSRESEIDVGVEKLNDTTIRVFVTDYGTGIPDSFKEKIFTKFSQADSSDTRQKGGTGLGLAISKDLIELMSGTIGYNSKKDSGSTFYVELAIAE